MRSTVIRLALFALFISTLNRAGPRPAILLMLLDFVWFVRQPRSSFLKSQVPLVSALYQQRRSTVDAGSGVGCSIFRNWRGESVIHEPARSPPISKNRTPDPCPLSPPILESPRCLAACESRCRTASITS